MRFFRGIFAIFEGMKTVFKHLFRHSVTLEYPEKKASLNSRFRGRLCVRKNESGDLDCIACRACIRVCPCVDAIKIESEKIENKTIIKKFELDAGKCIMCGNCTFVCPKNVLQMSSDYEFASEDKSSFVRGKDELLEEKEEK